MNLSEVFQGLDELFEQHRLDEVEDYLGKQLEQAVSENDFEAMVSILNEMLGFARETSQYDKCEIYGSQALKLIENSPYKGTISHATTLLNVANAMRAAGRLTESLANYQMTEQIYKAQLPENDYQFASLYNNEGLLFEEMQEYERAAQAFMRAIEIVSAYEGNEYYQAVSYANLANAKVMLRAYDEAEGYAKKAEAMFAALKVEDSHKGAALAALGEVCQARGENQKAISYYEQAKNCIFQHIGENAAYHRVRERLEYLKRSGGKEEQRISGAALCREYYELYGAQMIAEKFAKYAEKIAAGHVGEGSECFGFDDAISTDHDFGPGFSLWLDRETYAVIGKELQEAYEALPKVYKGYRRVESSHGRERFGVCVIEDFYERVLAGGHLPEKDTDYLQLEDCYLAAAVNGVVYRDDEGKFTAIRERLKKGYPEGVKLLKLAQAAARYGQNGQYNYKRCADRGEWTAAFLAKADAVRTAMQVAYLLENAYSPHDKWMHRGLRNLNPDIYELAARLGESDLKDVEGNCRLLEKVAQTLLERLKKEFYVTAEGDFLPDLSVEIARRGQLWLTDSEVLVRSTVDLMALLAKEEDRNNSEPEDKENVSEMQKMPDWRIAFLTGLSKSLLVQYRYDLENKNVCLPSGQGASKEREQIVETILGLEAEQRPDAYMVGLRREIPHFSDAMLVQYGRDTARNSRTE